MKSKGLKEVKFLEHGWEITQRVYQFELACIKGVKFPEYDNGISWNLYWNWRLQKESGCFKGLPTSAAVTR